jgi:DNA-binding Xre family transcriptional regulator
MSKVMICVQLKNTVSLEWSKELGLKVKSIRQAKSLFRKDLAKLIGVSYQLLEKIEMGSVDRIAKDNLYLLANALEVNVSEIYPTIEIKL